MKYKNNIFRLFIKSAIASLAVFCLGFGTFSWANSNGADKREEEAIPEEKGYLDWARDQYNSAVNKMQNWTREELTEELKRLYSKAKESGEQIPEDVNDWVKLELKKVRAWEYRTLQIPTDHANLVEEMNELGLEGWNCFHASQGKSSQTFFFKRQMKSYLRHLPYRDLVKYLFPDGQQ